MKHGNQPGDFRRAPRCLATNRAGKPCMAPAMRGNCVAGCTADTLPDREANKGWPTAGRPDSYTGFAAPSTAKPGVRHAPWPRSSEQLSTPPKPRCSACRRTDAASLRRRYWAERAIEEQLYALYAEVDGLLSSKLKPPPETNSKQGSVCRISDRSRGCGYAPPVRRSDAR